MSKMKKTIDVRSGVFLVIAILIVSTMAVGTDAAAAPYQVPKTIFWATKDVGTVLYQTAATIGEILAPDLGGKFRLIPGNDLEINIMMRQGKAHLGCMGQDAFWSCTGLGVYATRAFGPQPTRLLWAGVPAASGGTMIATKTSGIKTLADLKGKKLGNVIGATHYYLMYAAVLAYANLTLNDVKVVDYSSDGAKMRAFIEGKVDSVGQSLAAAGTVEAEVGPYGLYVIPIPPDKEAWARLNKVVPFFFPDLSTEGAGIKKGEPVWTIQYPFPNIVCGAETPDEFAYTMVRAIHKSLDKIVSSWSLLKALSVEKAIVPGVTTMAPFHPGAIKYFKEIGLWKPELETANQKGLETRAAWKARWDKFLEDVEKMTAGGKKVDIKEEWTKIMNNEFGFVLPKGF